MAGDTTRPFAACLVVVMRSGFIAVPLMALVADFVAFALAMEGMGIVAIATGHSLCVHCTLQEGGVDIDFLLALAIGE
jgi:hypothetical protein